MVVLAFSSWAEIKHFLSDCWILCWSPCILNDMQVPISSSFKDFHLGLHMVYVAYDVNSLVLDFSIYFKLFWIFSNLLSVFLCQLLGGFSKWVDFWMAHRVELIALCWTILQLSCSNGSHLNHRNLRSIFLRVRIFPWWLSFCFWWDRSLLDAR